MSQKLQIQQLLSSGEWVCGRTFLESFIPEYRSRINTLRKEGKRIINKPCTMHHHKSGMMMWKMGEKQKMCCPLYTVFQIHSGDCELKYEYESR